MPALSLVTFNDSVGSRTISPNGDGEQDGGTFEFRSNISGTVVAIIDTDRNGRLNPAHDVLFDAVARG